MKEDLFIDLPTEIMMDIFLRLPIRSIIMCKIVCKSWREVVGSLEFAKSHLSKAVPHLVLSFPQGEGRSILYKMVEYLDEHHSALRCNNIVYNLSLPHPGVIIGSVNGLLFWCKGDLWSPHDIFVCNPITSEYMKLPPPPELKCHRCIYGAGVSQMGGQYKIVKILQVYNEYYELAQCECHVHTVGSGSCRRYTLSTGTQFRVGLQAEGTFFNGKLHWLAFDHAMLVSCFDLETELFTSFSSPPGLQGHYYTLSVVGDRLCFCDSTSPYATDIWFMKEYGDEKSWTKEFIITKDSIDDELFGWPFVPIKVFINGDEISTAGEDCCEILPYWMMSKAIHATGFHKRCVLFARRSVIYTPTFLPLKNLLNVTENILSF